MSRTETPHPVRLCMIGAGKHAALNIYPYFHFLAGEAEVAANCDLELERARALGRRFGIERHYDDYERMVEEEQPDGVLVCIGDRAHAELAIELMERGFDVYTEKPHAPDLATSKRMLETAQATGRICMGAYKKRFGPAYRQAKRIIESEGFGRPTALRMMRSKGGRTEQQGGWLWQWGCHVTDLAHYLFGPVAEVQAWKTAESYGGISMNMRFVSGAVGNLMYLSPGPNWEQVFAVGEAMESVEVVNSIDLTHYRGNAPVDGHKPSFVAGYTQGSVEMGFVGELREFVASIREGRQPEANIASSTHTAALHEAMTASLASGAPAAVEQFDPSALPTPTRAGVR